MRHLIANVRAAFDLLRPSVYAPVYCDGCEVYRARITPTEHAVLLVHHRILCPCGGQWSYIGPDFERTS